MSVPEASPRSRRASAWLVERFYECAEWKVSDLFLLAKASRISKNALFEAKKQLGLRPAQKDVLPGGVVVWFWSVPVDWVPPELDPVEPSKPGRPRKTKPQSVSLDVAWKRFTKALVAAGWIPP